MSLLRPFFLTAFCLLAGQAADAGELRDATGVAVTVPEVAKRVVALAPSLGELAADVAGEDLSRIVGVSDFTDYPPALNKVKTIGPYAKFSIEEVVALHPDLVLATIDGNSKEQVSRLRELGLTVVVVNTDSFAAVEQSMRLVALAMGKPERGEEMARQFRQGLMNFRKRSAGRKEVSVLLQLGSDPLIVAGGNSFLNDALATLGAKNAYGGLRARYPRPGLEDAVRRNPEIIVVLSLGKDLRVFKKMAEQWRRFPSMKAVSGNRVFVISADAVLRPTLRLLEGLAILERTLYEK